MAGKRLLMKPRDIKGTIQRNFPSRASPFKSLVDRLSPIGPRTCPQNARSIDQYSENERKRVLEGRDREQEEKKKGRTEQVVPITKERAGRRSRGWRREGKNELCDESKMLVTMGTSWVLSWLPRRFLSRSRRPALTHSLALFLPRPLSSVRRAARERKKKKEERRECV